MAGEEGRDPGMAMAALRGDVDMGAALVDDEGQAGDDGGGGGGGAANRAGARQRCPLLQGPKRTAAIVGLVAVLVCGAVGLAYALATSNVGGDAGEGSAGSDADGDVTLRVPVWLPGATFNYTVLAPAHGLHLAGGAGMAIERMMAVNVGLNTTTGAYTLASDTSKHAVQHAVLDMFPFFGRITAQDLAVYEGGAPQLLFGTWPLTLPSSVPWEFTLFGREWSGQVLRHDRTGGLGGAGLVVFRARAREGGADVAELEYTLDLGVGFLSYLVYRDAGGPQVQLTLTASTALGFAGDAYFVRAKTLFDATWPGADADAAGVGVGQASGASGGSKAAAAGGGGTVANVSVSVHTDQFTVGRYKGTTPWDLLVYLVDASVGCTPGSSASVSMTAVGGGGATWPDQPILDAAPCRNVSGLPRTVQDPAAETTVDLRAATAGDGTAVRLRVAGGLLYKYTVA